MPNPLSIMATMRNISFREVNNARIASRMRQFVVLVVAIIIGMIISVSVNAQNSFKKSKLYDINKSVLLLEEAYFPALKK